jgi:hypothetical protein
VTVGRRRFAGEMVVDSTPVGYVVR